VTNLALGWQGRGRRHVVPGFRLSLGFTLFYLCVIVLIPLAVLVARAMGLGASGIWSILSTPRVLAALRVSFVTSALAAVCNLPLGLLVAWVLSRYEFAGRRLLDAMVDLPFALPTAVAGISLSTLYAQNGWIGSALAPFGIKVAYTPLGIFVALVFIGLPFVVRSVQPVLAEIDSEVEEASATLGASRWRTFRHVILPLLLPAVLTGFALALARGIGEYGSVIFIAGNIPFVSEIAPLLIVTKLSEFDYAGAIVIAVAMLTLSFLLLAAINLLQFWTLRKFGHD
jgi:sulfate/thiosulfate transport system permease protein